MVVKDFQEFVKWLTGGDFLLNGAIATFLGIALGCLILGLLLGYIVAVIRHGPFEAFFLTSSTLFQSVPDFIRTSPRRVYALARLAVKEAFRRKVVISAMGIFAIALLFGGWFFNAGSEHPERTYIGIVTWGSQLLILVMGLLISSFSLPDDIKNKTIYTVVTKPVRPTEIILGRIVGFAGLSTVLLVLMATICYLFVGRGLSHRHQIDGPRQTLSSLRVVNPQTEPIVDGRRIPPNTTQLGTTTIVNGHRHRLRVIRQVFAPDDVKPTDLSDVVRIEESPGQTVFYRVVVDPEGGHSHAVIVRGDGPPGNPGNDPEIEIGGATGFFRARVPLYAKSLLFTKADGETSEQGIVTGDLWTYRGYVQGGASLAKATFEYEEITAEQFTDPNRVDIEMTLGVYRSYKWDIDKRILASIYFESVPDPNADRQIRIQSDPVTFETVEFDVQSLSLPRKMIGRVLDENGNIVRKGESLDFYDDIAAGGKVRLVLRCEDRDQYLGVSRADIYFRAGERSYTVNFFKGFFGIWLQMLIVVTLAVTFSTFLNMSVTMFATMLVIVLGFVTQFIRDLLKPDADGGGPIESFVRLITQQNMQTPLQEGFLNSAMKLVDQWLLWLLNALTYVVPDFSRLDFSKYIQFGYWIDSDRLWIAAFLAFSFCIGLVVFGYFNLKTREIAA